MAWNGNKMRAVTHHHMLALTHDFEASLFKRLDCPEMINAGNFRHR